jgi:putative membrane protein
MHAVAYGVKTMKRYILAAALAVAACGNEQSDVAETPTTLPPAASHQTTTSNSMAAAALQEFPQRVALSDMYEVQASQMAVERAQAAPVRQFAQEMVTAHRRTTEQLRTALGAQAATLPSQLDPVFQRRLEELRTAPVNEFDALYLNHQVEAHQNAANMLREYAQNGPNPELKTFASQTLTAVEQHLQQARQLSASQSASANQTMPASP